MRKRGERERSRDGGREEGRERERERDFACILKTTGMSDIILTGPAHVHYNTQCDRPYMPRQFGQCWAKVNRIANMSVHVGTQPPVLTPSTCS